jgi:CRISPR-associated endonuclease/helicase Cas3
MTNKKNYQTQTGRVLTDEDIERISAEVESVDYDVEELRTRRRGRPSLGSEPSHVVTVRIDTELRAALAARAEREGMTVSSVHREALRQFLEVPEIA